MIRETRNLEFKKEVTNTFLKTVSAFSNYDGGRILFGVDDDGKVSGLQDTRHACLDIENKINDSISPQPVYTLSINDENRTVTLSVQKGIQTPYLYKSKAYKRSDSATVEVDTVELKRLILRGEHLRFEELPAGEQNLQFTVLNDMLREEIGITVSEPVLKTFNLYSDDAGYNNAAELLADENHFPGIDAARFGDSISIILKRKNVENQSVLTVFYQAVDLYRDAYQYEKIEGIHREKVELIPEDAFREVIACLDAPYLGCTASNPHVFFSRSCRDRVAGWPSGRYHQRTIPAWPVFITAQSDVEQRILPLASGGNSGNWYSSHSGSIFRASRPAGISDQRAHNQSCSPSDSN